jgi:aldehyde:ferredoxin oxidoreductase
MRGVQLVLNMKDWKYANILQQGRFTHCQNSMEHIRLGWQACRIPNGTHYECNANNKKQKCMALWASNDYFLDALTFCNFYFSQECNITYVAENFVVLLGWQRTMHTLSYFSKQVLVVGYVWVRSWMWKNEERIEK